MSLPVISILTEPRPGTRVLIVLCVFLAGRLSARDLRVGVDPEFPTIAHAIKAAVGGDTIHLEPKVYRDYAGFYAKKGEPGNPIILDGHGATLEGSDPLNPEQWNEVAPGLFAAPDLLPRFDEAMLGRWFFLFDGKMQLMGRTSKGRSDPLKTPEELAAGEWTFVKDTTREPPSLKQIVGTFYLKLEPGTSLADANIFVPVRSAGVQFSGDNAHLVIRNITATHPYNDGFNIHGDCRDVVFKNIRAIECGDDGISAHESAQYRVSGFVSIGNSTGICDTGTAQTSYDRVYIANCVAVDLYFLDEGIYRVSNALIQSSSQKPLVVTGRKTGECRLTMENVWIRRIAGPPPGVVAPRAVMEAKDCTFEAMELQITGEATLDNCLVNGNSTTENATGARQLELSELNPPNLP
jgi:hypothetical protein